MPALPNQQLPASAPAPWQNLSKKNFELNWAQITIISSIVIFIIILAVLAYWLFILRPKVESQPPLPSPIKKEASPSAKPATPSAEKDETADWMAYTNAEFGFSIKYPEGLKHISESVAKSDQENSFVTFSNNQDISKLNTISVTVSKGNLLKSGYDKIANKEINKTLKGVVAETIDVENTRLPDVYVDGVKSVKRSYVPTAEDSGLNYSLEVYIKRNNEYFKVHLIAPNKEGFESYKKLFDLMLSTFKFE